MKQSRAIGIVPHPYFSLKWVCHSLNLPVAYTCRCVDTWMCHNNTNLSEYPPGIIREMYIGHFCSLPPITLKPNPSAVYNR